MLVWLVCVLNCFSLDLSCMGFFVPFGLDRVFPFPWWGNFQLYSLEKFSIHFHFLFFWDPYNSNVGAFDIVPEVSETILSSFHSFSLFCFSAVISTILSSSSLNHSSASNILLLISSSVFLISVIVLFFSLIHL